MNDAKALSEVAAHGFGALKFSDLYLEPGGAWYKKNPTDPARHTPSGLLEEQVGTLRRKLTGHPTGRDFRMFFENVGLRVQRLATTEGDVYVCRRLLPKPIDFDFLRLTDTLKQSLLSEELSGGGLVLWTGGTGAGKSMSQASWLIKRLQTFGGTACALENPPEITLQGEHKGENAVVGTCYQIEVEKDEEYATEIQRLLRAAPNIIMIGEIRSRLAAIEAVLAGTSGQLVSATLHGNDVQTSLERLKTMVVTGGLDVTTLSDALAAVVHQRMYTERDGTEEVICIEVTPLVITGAINETGIRNSIRKGDFAGLSSEIERQRRLMNDPDYVRGL